MAYLIELRYSDDLPADPHYRRLEELACADRESLGLRFGEPCDPRSLVQLYDVGEILETLEQYDNYYGRHFEPGYFQELKGFSGLVTFLQNDLNLMLINPIHNKARRNLTLGHEFGHLAMAHEPSTIVEEGSSDHPGYNFDQEMEAFGYGLAALLPYAPLLQILRQGASAQAIAAHFGVSVQAVHMRLKLVGLWDGRY